MQPLEETEAGAEGSATAPQDNEEGYGENEKRAYEEGAGEAEEAGDDAAGTAEPYGAGGTEIENRDDDEGVSGDGAYGTEEGEPGETEAYGTKVEAEQGETAAYGTEGGEPEPGETAAYGTEGGEPEPGETEAYGTKGEAKQGETAAYGTEGGEPGETEAYGTEGGETEPGETAAYGTEGGEPEPGETEAYGTKGEAEQGETAAYGTEGGEPEPGETAAYGTEGGEPEPGETEAYGTKGEAEQGETAAYGTEGGEPGETAAYGTEGGETEPGETAAYGTEGGETEPGETAAYGTERGEPEPGETAAYGTEGGNPEAEAYGTQGGETEDANEDEEERMYEEREAGDEFDTAAGPAETRKNGSKGSTITGKTISTSDSTQVSTAPSDIDATDRVGANYQGATEQPEAATANYETVPGTEAVEGATAQPGATEAGTAAGTEAADATEGTARSGTVAGTEAGEGLSAQPGATEAGTARSGTVAGTIAAEDEDLNDDRAANAGPSATSYGASKTAAQNGNYSPQSVYVAEPNTQTSYYTGPQTQPGATEASSGVAEGASNQAGATEAGTVQYGTLTGTQAADKPNTQPGATEAGTARYGTVAGSEAAEGANGQAGAGTAQYGTVGGTDAADGTNAPRTGAPEDGTRMSGTAADTEGANGGYGAVASGEQSANADRYGSARMASEKGNYTPQSAYLGNPTYTSQGNNSQYQGQYQTNGSDAVNNEPQLSQYEKQPVPSQSEAKNLEPSQYQNQFNSGQSAGQKEPTSGQSMAPSDANNNPTSYVSIASPSEYSQRDIPGHPGVDAVSTANPSKRLSGADGGSKKPYYTLDPNSDGSPSPYKVDDSVDYRGTTAGPHMPRDTIQSAGIRSNPNPSMRAGSDADDEFDNYDPQRNSLGNTFTLKSGDGDYHLGPNAQRPTLISTGSRGQKNDPITNLDEMEEDMRKAATRGLPLDEFPIDIEKMRAQHKTDMYEDQELICRRGFKIEIKKSAECIEFYKTPNKYADTSNQELPGPGHNSVCLSSKDPKENGWELSQSEGMCVVKISPNCVIGRWKMYVDDKGPYNVLIIFNPWCEEDSVFMENDEERNEYVLKDTGRIYKDDGHISWFYGQFEKRILNITLKILNYSCLYAISKNSPVLVCKAVSHCLNAYVLEAIWDGVTTREYVEGMRSPSAWTGSKEILYQFNNDHCRVKHGESYNFAGLLCTVLRALGIPTRAVTCIGCVSDNDGNFMENIVWDERECKWKHENNDAFYKFRVWNEVWLKRVDLPQGYDGWQALDSNCRIKTSHGFRQMGPAPLQAVKAGKADIPYDTGYIFASVNGEIVRWYDDKYGRRCLHSIQEREKQGQMICQGVATTKQVDITSSYKPKEGTQEEKDQVLNAVSCGNQPYIYKMALAKSKNQQPPKVKANVPNIVRAGDPVKFQFEVESGCEWYISCFSKNHNGIVTDELMNEHAREKTSYQGEIDWHKYHKHALIGSILEFQIYCKNKSTGSVNTPNYFVSFDLGQPKLKVLHNTDENRPQLQYGKTQELLFSFKNELPISLTGVKFIFSAPGIRHGIFNVRSNLPAGEERYVRIEWKPRKAGTYDLMLNVISKETTCFQNIDAPVKVG